MEHFNGIFVVISDFQVTHKTALIIIILKAVIIVHIAIISIITIISSSCWEGSERPRGSASQVLCTPTCPPRALAKYSTEYTNTNTNTKVWLEYKYKTAAHQPGNLPSKSRCQIHRLLGHNWKCKEKLKHNCKWDFKYWEISTTRKSLVFTIHPPSEDSNSQILILKIYFLCFLQILLLATSLHRGEIKVFWVFSSWRKDI